MLSIVLLPCNVHSHMKVHFYQFFVIATSENAGSEDAEVSVFFQPSPL